MVTTVIIPGTAGVAVETEQLEQSLVVPGVPCSAMRWVVEHLVR